MKQIIRHICISFVCVLLPCMVSAQNLYDDFNGTIVNPNLWDEILPFPKSQITESGGSLITAGGGILATAVGFDYYPLVITGVVTLNNQREHFQTILRTDLSVWPPGTQSHEITGINVEFSADTNQISIQQFTAGQQNPILLALASFNFTAGQPYDFTITDDKTNVRLYINGAQFLSGKSTFSSGDKIAFESRALAPTSSSLDFIQIQSEPSIGLVKAVKPLFSNLYVGVNYQLQVSTDSNNWTNQGSVFTATNSNMIYPNYVDVNDWDNLFFRAQAAP
jgi:hypothetical protein